VSKSTDFPFSTRDTIPLMPTKVTVLDNGPIRIDGEFEILDPRGSAFGLAGRTVISLCRCGQSANKPFCDGSHARTGFSDPVTARELPPPKPKL
jgi:CDGSH-type Zn-finger protein